MRNDPRYRTARWRQTRDYVLRRDGRRCAIPGCRSDMTRLKMTHVDHIEEVSRGGEFWDPTNLQVLKRSQRPGNRSSTHSCHSNGR